MQEVILVTGAAGFIGSHLAKALLDRGHRVIGFDNINDYYDIRLKADRLKRLEGVEGFTFIRGDLQDKAALDAVFETHRPQKVVNLAAQVGVRYSLVRPDLYTGSNIVGFAHVLEACRNHKVEHLVYASSSSVYGANTKLPFSVEDSVDHPINLYAATKKANELMAHSYSHLFQVPTTGFRFFTVYGPWGRPDMAVYSFAKAIHSGRPIDVYNNGQMLRDFTYIDDIIKGVVNALFLSPGALEGQTARAAASNYYRVLNIGNHQAVELLHVIELLEKYLGRKAQMRFLPMQPGDVPATYADMKETESLLKFTLSTPIELGIAAFVKWFLSYHQGSLSE